MPHPHSIDIIKPSARRAEEHAISTSAFGSAHVDAQPLSGWLLAAIASAGYKRMLSSRVADMFGVHSKTWSSGLSTDPTRRVLDFACAGASFERALKGMDPEIAVRRRRAIERAISLKALHPEGEPCVLFQSVLGAIGGDISEVLAIRLDSVSAAVRSEDLAPETTARLIVAAAERAGAVAPGAIKPSTDLDPGLDATLSMFARLDVDLAERLMRDPSEITSLFCMLIDTSGGRAALTVRRRLLNIFYAIARVSGGKAFPARAPTIRQLEDILMGGPHEAGTQSWMVRWSAGTTKRILLSHVLDMSAEVQNKTGVSVEGHFRRLYLAGLLLQLVEATGRDALMRVGERYRDWWNAQETPGRAKVAAAEPFWAHFEPYS